jgi:hypothetical protein
MQMCKMPAVAQKTKDIARSLDRFKAGIIMLKAQTHQRSPIISFRTDMMTHGALE